MSITTKTRREARDKVAPLNWERVLQEIAMAGRALGATEIARRLRLPVTSVRPRCTELKGVNYIKAVGRHRLRNGRSEATWVVSAINHSIGREDSLCSAFVPAL